MTQAFESTAWAPLESMGFDVVEGDASSESSVIASAQSAWAVIAGGETYDARFFERAPSVRVLARAGSGYDAIDVTAATDAGVVVFATIGANAAAVADFTIGLMLACVRGIATLSQSLASGGWGPPFRGRDLTGARVGIVGLGSIGREVVRRLDGFGCSIVASEMRPDQEFCWRYGVRIVPLSSLLGQVDILSLHVPLTPSTVGLIGEAQLALLPQSAVLVNTSRGEVVDEGALVRAIASGRLAGAALDVFWKEPLPADSVLRSLPSVVLTPHSASDSHGALQAIAHHVCEGIHQITEGRRPSGALNAVPVSESPT